MNGNLTERRRFYGFVLKTFAYLCAGLTAALIISLVAYVFYRGLRHITWEFLTTARSAIRDTIGILPNIINTVYIILTTLVISVPVGVGAAVWLNEYAANSKPARAVEFAVETLAGLPSVIFGLAGYLIFCQKLGLGTSILAGSLTLTFMILPVVVRTAQEALRTVPHINREGAVSLGASRWQMIRTIVLPGSMDGVVGGIILSVGRIVGESAALLFTAGTAYTLVTNYVKALGTSGGSLSVALYIYVYEHGKFDAGFAIASVLMLIALAVNISARFVRRKLSVNR